MIPLIALVYITSWHIACDNRERSHEMANRDVHVIYMIYNLLMISLTCRLFAIFHSLNVFQKEYPPPLFTICKWLLYYKEHNSISTILDRFSATWLSSGH